MRQKPNDTKKFKKSTFPTHYCQNISYFLLAQLYFSYTFTFKMSCTYHLKNPDTSFSVKNCSFSNAYTGTSQK